MSRPLIVFDMEGVLVDVTAGYRAAVIEASRHFTGVTVTPESLQEGKKRGGHNNDRVLCHHYCRELGVDLHHETVVDYFNGIFFGRNNDGLIVRECWVPQNGLLERLAERYRPAIFTGRNRRELEATRERFVRTPLFEVAIATDDIDNGKPAPGGLHEIARRTGAAIAAFLGDTVDDAGSARAAGVPFIGVAAAGTPRPNKSAEALRGAGAAAVIENVNELVEVVPR